MRNYTTQMDAARQGIITPEMKAVAKKEYRTEENIRDLVARGQAVICANKLHTCIDPNGVGSMLRTKINVNLGVSRDCKDYDVEMRKVMAAVDMGAEAIMDLSSHGNTQPFRRKLTSECPAMIGTVPVYDSVIHYQRDLATLTARDFIDVIRLHAEDGVDFVTLHCGITRKTVEQIKKQINRSVEVIKLVDYTDRPIHMREILFVRVNGCSDSDITELFRISNVFDVPIIDYDSTTVLLECIQTENWNNDLISLLSRKFSNRIEIVRGGSVAVEAVSISER